MASLGIEPEELRVVEQLRQRLSLIVQNLASLRVDVSSSATIPSASSLQASNSILNNNLRSLSEVMTENSDLMQRLVIRPSSNFPGRTHEGLLTTVLRKKPEPLMEARHQRGREIAAALEQRASDGSGEGGIDEMREMWDEASDWFSTRIATYVRDEAWSLFTAEEKATGIENVRHGLRRDLVAMERDLEKAHLDRDEDEEEEEEEEEEDDDDVDLDDDDDDMDDDEGVGAGLGGAGRRTAHPLEDAFFDFGQSAKRLALRGKINYVGAPGGGTRFGRP